MASSISQAIRRTSEVLKLGASRQVMKYQEQFSSLKNLYDDLISNLTISDFSPKESFETAKDFFGSSIIRFAGIDGTMYSHPLFDLVIFFGGAYASMGTVRLSETDEPRIQYDKKTIRQSAGISSVVPVYINELPAIDQTFFGEENIERKAMRDEAIINNATIANWIMTFAEYYLAYKLATDPEQKIRIVLLDRSLSVDRASLLYDTSKHRLWEARSSIIGYIADDEPIDKNDLMIARQFVCNQTLELPPPRSDYLQYAIMHLLRREGKLTEDQIAGRLGITCETRGKRVKRYLKRLVNMKILKEQNRAYALIDKYLATWPRVKKLVTSLGHRLFTEKPEIETANLLKILKNGNECWLTTLDVAFLTLFTLQMLIEECWEKRILLVGMTKDTAARDFKRQLIPLMLNGDLLKDDILKREVEELPNTDRMILQSVSILNPQKMVPPWSLIEYDSAFRTMVPNNQNRKGYVSGAIKNRISLEKTFLKTYVQLSQAKTDPILRSNVLLVDRLVYPEYDYKPRNIVEFWNEFGGAKEPIEVILFIDKTFPNELQNLTMTILSAMAPSSIPEAFGHNKPLFIADKIAKWNYSQFKRIVDTTADWILYNNKLRRFVFYMSTFRERRATIEAARRERF